ncbi:MAG: peptide-methionine (S)-S-oxide reductase MsrA [Pseudomonadota bacterium]
MRNLNTLQIAVIIAFVSAFGSFLWTGAGAQGQSQSIETAENTEVAVFAGGCFWCVESDFDKVDGVLSTVSGYAGGETQDPTYKSHAADRHLEVVEVTFDADVVSYEELVGFFFRHIDPTDAGGQFCDRGHSYTSAIFAQTSEQAEIARSEIDTIEALGILPGRILTPIRGDDVVYPAEDYHQNYYQKNPLKYQYYRRACGRDARVADVWSMDVEG